MENQLVALADDELDKICGGATVGEAVLVGAATGGAIGAFGGPEGAAAGILVGALVGAALYYV